MSGPATATSSPFAALNADPAFDTVQADEVAITVPANRSSRAVMERLGMIHDPAGDFDHPNLPAGHALQRYVLYRSDVPFAFRGNQARNVRGFIKYSSDNWQDVGAVADPIGSFLYPTQS